MAYQSNIPLATDRLSVSQGDLLGNFQALATLVLPNSGTVTFVNQGVAPTVPANQQTLYAKIPTSTSVSTLSELNIIKTSFSGDVTIPFTASVLSNVAAADLLNPGWFYLPCGLLVKWGRSVIGSGAITIPSGAGASGPAFTHIFHAMVIPYGVLATASWDGVNVGMQRILVSCSNAGATLAYLVIGVG